VAGSDPSTPDKPGGGVGAGVSPPGAGVDAPPGAGVDAPPGAGVDAPPGAGVDPPGAGTAAQSTFFNFESVFSVAHVGSVQLHW